MGERRTFDAYAFQIPLLPVVEKLPEKFVVFRRKSPIFPKAYTEGEAQAAFCAVIYHKRKGRMNTYMSLQQVKLSRNGASHPLPERALFQSYARNCKSMTKAELEGNTRLIEELFF